MRITRRLKRLVIVACAIAVLALPAGANAMLPPDRNTPVISNPSSGTTVVHEVRTTHDARETLAIVLAGVALTVALATLATTRRRGTALS